MAYYNFSGKLLDINTGISINNRAFRYADGLFESMYFTNGKIMFLQQHYARLRNGMEVLRIDTNNLPSIDEIEHLAKKLIAANEIETSARIRMQVFRKAGGLYLPEDNTCDYIIEATALNNTEYQLNTKGLHIGISNSIKRNANIFSQIKTTAKQDMVLVAMDAKDNKWDDAILMNNSDSIVETSSSNIFAVINGNIYTPTLSDGALNGIMRQNIIEIAKQNKLSVIETSLNESNLLTADEIFISNAVKGIQWVVAFGTKRYFNSMSKSIISLLNKKINE